MARPRILTAAAATVAMTALVGWSIPGWGWLTSWGGDAASAPWTVVTLLVLAGATLVAPPTRQVLAGVTIWMATTALAGPELVGTIQRTVWDTAPTRPAFGVDIAIVLLAIAAWTTAVEVLDGLPTALAAGAAAVANLSIFGRVTGETWLATGGVESGPGAISLPTIATLLLLSMSVAIQDDARPFALLTPAPRMRRWVVAVVTATLVPLAVAIAQPNGPPRGSAGYATTALLVSALTLVVQLASVAAEQRDTLATVIDMVETSPDATLLVDATGHIVTANAAAEVTFAAPRLSLVGMSVDTLVPLGRRLVPERSWLEFLRRPLVQRADVQASRVDGSAFPAQVWLSPLRLRSQPVVAATVRDITLHARQIEQLQALQEMQEVFMMAISHELRTPLTVVSGIADTLRERGNLVDEDRRQDLLERLSTHARRLNDMIHELLDIERLRRGMAPTQAPLDVGPLVEEQARESARDRRQDVTVTIAPDLPPVAADAVLLVRVVDNLLANAAKYAPGPVEVRVTRQGDGILLAVEDHGPGVPGGLREQIFQPFRRGDQLHPATPGVGVGLALVAGLATSTGGRAWVQGRDDDVPGASFRLYLPAAAPPVEPPDVAPVQDVPDGDRPGDPA